MKDEGFLVFTQDGIDGRILKRPPGKLAAGQYAIRLRLAVPDRFFAQPTPTVDLEIPESATLGPPVSLDVSSLEDVCAVERLLPYPDEDGRQDGYRCPECGFTSWNPDTGPHYKPDATPTPPLKGEEVKP